jgi:hypothetical protein
MMAHPTIEIFAPPAVEVGRTFCARVVLRCFSPVQVTGVQIAFFGLVSWSDFAGEIWQDAGMWRRIVQLVPGPTRLAKGAYPFDLEFEIPAGDPPTYIGSSLRLRWGLRAVVGRPRWFDVRREISVRALPPPTATDAPPRRVYASSVDGPRPGRPYAEAVLDSSVLVPGERCRDRLRWETPLIGITEACTRRWSPWSLGSEGWGWGGGPILTASVVDSCRFVIVREKTSRFGFG